MIFFFNLKSKRFIISNFALSLIIFSSFIASNRISFFILIALILILTLFFKMIRKNLIFAIILSLPILIILYQNDNSINVRYTGFFQKVDNLILNFKDNYFNKKNSNIVKDKIYNSSKNNLNSSEPQLPLANHGKIFLTAYESFKTQKILGNGYKSFRIKCFVFANEDKNYLCSTHPHNYHLEVLHDTGIIGFSILSFFVISLLTASVKRLLKTDISYENKIIISLLVVNLLIELFLLNQLAAYLLPEWVVSMDCCFVG